VQPPSVQDLNPAGRAVNHSRRDTFRILYFYPYVNFDTGSPKAMVQFIQTLDTDVFHPMYCAPGPGPLTAELAMRGVEIVHGTADSINFRNPLAALAAINRQSKLLKSWRVDLLHANSFVWNTDLILAAWMLRIPVILHVHNPLDVEYRNLARFAARKVLFCSQFEMTNCGHLERIAGKAEVLHNAIDTQAFGQGRSIRQRLGLHNDEIAIGTVAQVTHRKGIDLLIETARILLRERNDLVFLVAGPYSEVDFGQRMLAAAEAPELMGRVRFLGARSDIPDFMASLDLFFLPSRAEPLGLVVLEAMASGVPVIASKVGGIPEILTSPDIGRLVDPVTPDRFADTIRDILSQPDVRRSMGEKAKLELVGRFDLRTGGERLKKIYVDLLRR
jgi:glycosyltransferase involved in cell wall biosynthesis